MPSTRIILLLPALPSLIAWQHIKLRGRYEFQKQPAPLNVDAIIRELTEIPSDRGDTLAA